MWTTNLQNPEGRISNRTLFRVWILLATFLFCLHALGSLSRFSEIDIKILDLRPMLAADIVWLFVGIVMFANQSKFMNIILELFLLVLVVEISLTLHLATRNGMWGFDAVLDYGTSERIYSEGWKGAGAYPQLFAVYDYPALFFLTSTTQLTSSLPLSSVFLLVPISMVLMGMIALLSLLKRILPVRDAMLAAFVLGVYPCLLTGSYNPQTIGTSLMLVMLVSLVISKREAPTNHRGTLLVMILLPSLLMGHILEPYVLLLLALYSIISVLLFQSSKLNRRRQLALPGRSSLRLFVIPKASSILIIVVVASYWIFINQSLFERFGGVLLQLFGQQPLGRQFYASNGASAYDIFLQTGEHLLVLSFLGLGTIHLLFKRSTDGRELDNLLIFPLALFVSTEFLALFKSAVVQIARTFLWIWVFLVGYAISRIHHKRIPIRLAWSVLMALFVIWSYCALSNTEAFYAHHRYDYERGEYKPYLLDSEIQGARWFNLSYGTVVGDQGAWHLLTAYTDAHVVVDLDAIDRGPDGLDRYDWFFFRYENENLAFDAYGGQNATRVTVDELNQIDQSTGIVKVFDNGGAAIYKLSPS